jgi:hypothetical protein
MRRPWPALGCSATKKIDIFRVRILTAGCNHYYRLLNQWRKEPFFIILSSAGWKFLGVLLGVIIIIIIIVLVVVVIIIIIIVVVVIIIIIIIIAMSCLLS